MVILNFMDYKKSYYQHLLSTVQKKMQKELRHIIKMLRGFARLSLHVSLTELNLFLLNDLKRYWPYIWYVDKAKTHSSRIYNKKIRRGNSLEEAKTKM